MEYVFVDDLHRYKRLKVTRACESCRRRKVKCDGGSGGTQTPCSSCRKLKILCVFSNMTVKRTTPKTEQEQMDEKLQRSESLLQKLDDCDIKSRKVNGVGYVDLLTDVLGHMKIECNGRASYIYSMEGKMMEEGGSPELLLLTEPPLPYHYPLSSTGNPTPEMASHLINLYFIHVHPYIPILHKDNFLRRLNDKSNPISPLLLYTVFALGAKYVNDPSVCLDPTKSETAGIPFYRKAKDLLDDFLDVPRLSTIQAQILLLKFQEGIRRPGFFFRSWLCFGTIIRMAQDLGLDKNFDKWDLRISKEDKIVRKRIWQVCFLCDQFMSGAQGREIAITLSNTDIELPKKEDYGDAQELQIQTDFVHIVRLTKILSSVMPVISPAGSSGTWSSNPKLHILDTVLDAWLQALPPRLRCQLPTDNNSGTLPQPPSSHFAGFLNILYHTIIILLHRPYLADSGKVSQQNPNHLNICTVAANSISQITQVMLEQWGANVFQYPIRGGNYGTYCLVAASMIHLVNMSSNDLRFSQPAHDYLSSTLSVLKVCVEQSAAWELRDKVQGLEIAFTTQRARQSFGLLFHPGSPNDTNGGQMNNLNNRRRPPMPRRRATTPNTQSQQQSPGLTTVTEVNQQMLSSSLPDNFTQFPRSSPHFQERPLYIITENSASGHQTPEQGSPYSHGSPVGSVVDPVIVASQNHDDMMLATNNTC
ncbi:11316_t:CDS:2 [Diversispora eburnea]|uniref:11316_t:CDS:1 n=1 Tax=Diversispora eburnea TaxID=1213867 RepID=A0A9N8Z734_9GLOM|nr:11316_t:CDS:2 [Diversispora eburnea]